MEAGLLLVGRNPDDEEAKAIRWALNSYSNHNGMTVNPTADLWGVCEGVSPVSRLTTFSEYEELMNNGYIVRLYRIKTLTKTQRLKASKYFMANLLGLRYPKKWKMVLLGTRFLNELLPILHIRLTWCSQLCKRAFISEDYDCLDGPKGKKKDQFTPRTFENRIIQGLFEDVTDEMIIVTEKDEDIMIPYGTFAIGESVPMRAKLTLMAKYEKKMAMGKVECKIYRTTKED